MNLREGVIIKKNNKSGFIIDTQNRLKQKINLSAAVIMEKLYEDKTLDQLNDELSKEFEMESKDLIEDVIAFTAAMKDQGLIIEGGPNTNRYLVSPRLEKVTLQLTNRCNLNCRHCLVESGQGNAVEELSTEEWKRVIDELYYLGVYDVVVTGGEIFIRDDIFELLEYMKGKFFVNIFTNGLLLDSDKIKKLCELNIYSVQISLDGATAETNDFIRGKGTFERILETIKMLVAGGLKVSIASTITKLNFPELNKFVELAGELGVAAIGLGEAIDMGRGSNIKDILLSAEEMVEVNRFTVNQLAQHMSTGVKVGPLIDGDVNYDFSPDSFQERNLCGAIRNGIYVMPQGNVCTCLQFVDVPEFHSGNVKRNSLKDLWYHSDVHKCLRGLSVDDCEGCNICKYKVICGGSCRAIAYKKHGKLTGKPYNMICKSIQVGLESALKYTTEVASTDEMLELLIRNSHVEK